MANTIWFMGAFNCSAQACPSCQFCSVVADFPNIVYKVLEMHYWSKQSLISNILGQVEIQNENDRNKIIKTSCDWEVEKCRSQVDIVVVGSKQEVFLM